MPTNNLKNTDALRLVYSNEHFSLLKKNVSIKYFMYLKKTTVSAFLCEIDPEETITALAYQDSTIWIGTDRGLGCYDMIHKKFHHIHTNYFEKISFLIGDKKRKIMDLCTQQTIFLSD